MHRRAFSLMELLVVVGIVAVLIAMLLPALNRARFAVRTVQCQSNLRQQGQALAMYLSDSKNFYPPGWWNDNNPAGSHELFIWVGKEGQAFPIAITRHRLNKYLGYNTDGAQIEVPIARCPSDDTGETGWPSPTLYDFYGTSYRWNHHFNFRNLVRSWWEATTAVEAMTGVNASKIRRQSEFVVAHDIAVFGWSWLSSDGARPASMVWHSKAPQYKWNLLFADGHVALTRVLPGVRNSADYRMDRE